MSSNTPPPISDRTLGETRAIQTDDTNLLDILQIFAERLRLLVLGPIVVGLLVFAFTFTITPTYLAGTRFLPPQQQQSSALGMLQSLGGLGLVGAAAGLKNPADQYVAFLRSVSVEDAIIERFKLQDRYDEKYKQGTRTRLEAATKIIAGKDGLISLEFEDHDPEFAALVANAYLDELGSLMNRLAVTEAQQRRVFFEKQLSASKDNLVKAEQILAASGVGTSALNASPTTALEGPARLRAQVTAQEVKLASMRSYLTESAPEYRQALAELGALKGQLSKAERAQPSSAGGPNNDYITKYRDFKYQETLFELFARQYEMARVDESREGAVIQVIDPAVTPELKSKPRKALLAVAATLVTGFFLLIWVFVTSALDRRGRDDGSKEKLKKLRTTFRNAVGLRT